MEIPDYLEPYKDEVLYWDYRYMITKSIDFRGNKRKDNFIDTHYILYDFRMEQSKVVIHFLLIEDYKKGDFMDKAIKESNKLQFREDGSPHYVY